MLKAQATVSFYVFGVVLLASLLIGLYTDNYVWFAVPAAIIVAGIGVTNIRYLFWALLFFLPLSVEIELPGGFGTDLPDEFIMVGLMVLTLAYLISHRDESVNNILTNPIALLLIVHFAWILFSMAASSLFIVSLKYSLAKLWYLTVFVVLTVILTRNLSDFKYFFWILTIPLLFTVIYTLANHSTHGFSFASVNTMMKPFFRNHVNYAAMVSIWLPFIWLAWGWYSRNWLIRIFLLFTGLIFIAGLILSYTRSGWLAVIIAVAVAVLVKLKVMRYAIVLSFIALVAGVIYMRADNKFMDYAPDYKRTIYHKNLDQHLQSTYKLEDISSAERVYRWIAGYKMWEANPFIGYGPGNFYNFYKGYTVSLFRTYVSDNPEKSTVHNYFLLILVEQGIIGLVVFVVLTFAIFIYAERLYHRITDKQDKRWALAITMSLAAIYVNNMLSDLIETDKVGSIYFINIGMLMVLMYKYPALQKPSADKRDVVVE